MDKLSRYRALITKILQNYTNIINQHPHSGEETLFVVDDTHDHYILHTIGWQGVNRVWNTTVYVRIINEKFYIEIDWLEQGIASALLAEDVPKTDIVLAFHHPEVRPLTEFAVA